jgi:hypothetical protein
LQTVEETLFANRKSKEKNVPSNYPKKTFKVDQFFQILEQACVPQKFHRGVNTVTLISQIRLQSDIAPKWCHED